jgi:DNA-binding NarL/FixJ family response regulator
MIDYAAVLKRRHPNRLWTLNANDYEQLTMLDDGEKPSKKSLDDAWPDVQEEITAESESQNAARESALAKLAALGLTDAEIAALVGA